MEYLSVTLKEALYKGYRYMRNFGEGKQVFIRRSREEDYSIYREVTYAHSAYKNVFTEKFMQGIWKEANAPNGLACTVIEANTGDICGFARGDFDVESDIDVMIIMNCNKEEVCRYRKQISRVASRIGLENDIEVSLLLRDRDTFEQGENVLPLYKSIQREEITLHG